MSEAKHMDRGRDILGNGIEWGDREAISNRNRKGETSHSFFIRNSYVKNIFIECDEKSA